MTTEAMYNTPIRRGVFQRLQYGDKHISEIASNLPTVKGNVHYHLKQLEDKGTVVQVEKEYWLKKDVRKEQRKVEQRFKKFQNKLKRQLAYKPNLGAFWKRYKDYQHQEEQFEKMGFKVPTFTPEDIVKSKRTTVKRVLSRNGNFTHRKFEQMHEYKLVRGWVERVFGLDLGQEYSKIKTRNPMLTEKLKSALT